MSKAQNKTRIFLSPPHMGGEEIKLVQKAFESNYIAPVGPQVDEFEKEFCEVIGSSCGVALNCGTAALHLALKLIGVGPGDEVLTSSLTFVGSASPIIYLGAKPVFVDSSNETWNMDPNLLADEIIKRAKKNRLPKALVLVHLYGQCGDLAPILEVCNSYEVPLIEDAAEALGATYDGRFAGTFGEMGIFSFNGNKIITTSGGGMIVSDQETLIERARFLSAQARDPESHYEHSQIGYNYRISNILAAIGLGQLKVLYERIEAKRRIFEYYREGLGNVAGIEFMPEASYGRCTRWLTCLTIDHTQFGTNRDIILQALENENIEARPVWKPMHLQPVFADYEYVGGNVAEDLFNRGLCLPSGTALTKEDLNRVISVILSCRK